MTCRPFGPHALMGDPYRPAGCTCGTLANPHGGTMQLQRLSPKELEQRIHQGHPPPTPPDPRDTALHVMPDPPGQSLTELVAKGPETTMTTATHPAAPERIDATRANALAIEGAYKIRETQGRLLELAAKVAPTAQKASLLKLEIRNIEAELANIESQHMAAVSAAVGADNKKFYSNKEAREAAVAKAVAEDPNAQALAASLQQKRTDLAEAEADDRAITTEVGILKAVIHGGAAALNALGLAAV